MICHASDLCVPKMQKLCCELLKHNFTTRASRSLMVRCHHCQLSELIKTWFSAPVRRHIAGPSSFSLQAVKVCVLLESFLLFMKSAALCGHPSPWPVCTPETSPMHGVEEPVFVVFGRENESCDGSGSVSSFWCAARWAHRALSTFPF